MLFFKGKASAQIAQLNVQKAYPSNTLQKLDISIILTYESGWNYAQAQLALVGSLRSIFVFFGS